MRRQKNVPTNYPNKTPMSCPPAKRRGMNRNVLKCPPKSPPQLDCCNQPAVPLNPCDIDIEVNFSNQELPHEKDNECLHFEAEIDTQEQNDKAVRQIDEIKKYMIGASEFDILEKLIDLDAPKHVIEYQMRKIEAEDQDPVVNTDMFNRLEEQYHQEVTEKRFGTGSANYQQDAASKCLPTARKQLLETTQRPSYDRNIKINSYSRPTTSRDVRFEDPGLRFRMPDLKTETDICSCIENAQNTEKDLLQNLGKLLDAEQVDAIEISELMPKINSPKTCDGFSILDGFTFKDAVNKTLAAAMMKLNEKEEEVQPEVAAAMLHSEEKGVSLSKAPREIYDSLFPESKEKPVIEVAPASSTKSRDVLPLPSVKLKSVSLKEDAALLDYSGTGVQTKFSLPEANLQEEEEGNEDDVLGIVDSQVINEEAATFKVMLTQGSQDTCSQVQMRGSQPPAWFPGYFFATPDNDNIISVDKPWTILEKAWQTFRPNKVKPKKGAILIGK